MENIIKANNERMVAEFKQRVLANAEETKRAWVQGINKFINRHADLMMVESYVTYYGANEQELVDFINEAYKI